MSSDDIEYHQNVIKNINSKLGVDMHTTRDAGKLSEACEALQEAASNAPPSDAPPSNARVTAAKLLLAEANDMCRKAKSSVEADLAQKQDERKAAVAASHALLEEQEKQEKENEKNRKQEAERQAQLAAKEEEARVRVIQEAELWAKIKLTDCAKPQKADSCDFVETYIRKFPDGPHIEEAKKSYQEGSFKLAALKKAAALKEEAERKKAALKEEAERKKEEKSICIKSCKEKYESVKPGLYEVYVNRCVANNCLGQ